MSGGQPPREVRPNFARYLRLCCNRPGNEVHRKRYRYGHILHLDTYCIFLLTTLRACARRFVPCSLRACSRDDPECGARCGVPRRRLVTVVPGGTGPRPPGTTTWLRGARCTDSGGNAGDGSADPGAKNRHGGAPGGVRPASWDARRLARRLACRVMARTNGCSAERPNVSRRSATPRSG
jgi:hypothetical protein